MNVNSVYLQERQNIFAEETYELQKGHVCKKDTTYVLEEETCISVKATCMFIQKNYLQRDMHARERIYHWCLSFVNVQPAGI